MTDRLQTLSCGLWRARHPRATVEAVLAKSYHRGATTGGHQCSLFGGGR